MITLISIATIYLLICIALFFLQRSLIYFPQPRAYGTVATTLQLNNEPGILIVNQIPARGGNAKAAIVYFPGNAEDASYSAAKIAQFFPNYAVFSPHYRGYGGSSGAPSEPGILADARILLDHVRATHPRIVLIGRSLGSGVACQMAQEMSNTDLQALVLITPFDSIKAIATQQFPWLPIALILQDKYRSDLAAAEITAPTLLLTAENDPLIPAKNSHRLLQHFRPGVAQLLPIPNTDHNDISNSPQYWQQIRNFITSRN